MRGGGISPFGDMGFPVWACCAITSPPAKRAESERSRPGGTAPRCCVGVGAHGVVFQGNAHEGPSYYSVPRQLFLQEIFPYYVFHLSSPFHSTFFDQDSAFWPRCARPRSARGTSRARAARYPDAQDGTAPPGRSPAPSAPPARAPGRADHRQTRPRAPPGKAGRPKRHQNQPGHPGRAQRRPSGARADPPTQQNICFDDVRPRNANSAKRPVLL